MFTEKHIKNKASNNICNISSLSLAATSGFSVPLHTPVQLLLPGNSGSLWISDDRRYIIKEDQDASNDADFFSIAQFLARPCSDRRCGIFAFPIAKDLDRSQLGFI